MQSVQAYPKFTPEMKATHTLLIPNMAPIHFEMMRAAMEDEGYRVKVLGSGGHAVAQEGLRYVHNDTCYPALLVIGQFINALKSGAYDVNHTALLITQTGGGCRASNYIHLLRKALVKAGFPQVPVASLNFSGLEKDSGFRLSPTLLRRFAASIFYGDALMSLANQTRPYENEPGAADACVARWTREVARQFGEGRGVSKADMAKNFAAIAAEFAAVPVTRVPKVKVGVVGEIYVKYSPLGNNGLERFLQGEGCEVNLPGLMGFVQYCVANMAETVRLYGGSKFEEWGADAVLTAEMIELQMTGFENIVCAQPFGCLPNHICGKGMINRIRAIYPQANITPIDYDPGATRVNQENRIKLMLSVARERLGQSGGTPPADGRAERPAYGGADLPGISLPPFPDPVPAHV